MNWATGSFTSIVHPGAKAVRGTREIDGMDAHFAMRVQSTMRRWRTSSERASRRWATPVRSQDGRRSFAAIPTVTSSSSTRKWGRHHSRQSLSLDGRLPAGERLG